MKKYGLIGYPLSHSFSPGYFSRKFQRECINDATYDAYPIQTVEDVLKLFEAGIDGLNVTIPYKEQVIPYLDDLSDEAVEINAVNTIKRVGGQYFGFNTDVYGFEESLIRWCGQKIPESALILGSGGASKAVAFVLDKLNLTFDVVSRKRNYLNYDDLNADILQRNKLIINTTPLGMAPKLDDCPDIPYHFLTENHFLYDLIYNPEKTLFLKKGENRFSQIKNGYEMLILQAEKSWEIWNKD